MKKIFCAALALLMIAALMAPAFAAEKLGSKSVNPTATILGKSTKGVKIDGVVDQYEYEEIKYTADNMRYNGTDDAFLAAIQKYNFKMYACWDTAKLYVAIVVDTPNYAQTQAASSMWQEYCAQVSCAKADEKTAATRNEYGFGKTSDKNALIFNAWATAYNAKWTPKTDGSEFQVVTKNNVTTYEAAIPAAAFGQDSFKQGDKLGLNICVNVGSQHVGDKKRGQIEWSQGCGGGKDATKFGKVTLGEQIKIPVATTTKAAATTAAKAATTAAAKTADVSVVIAAVATIALAGVVVCKKKH